MSDGQAKFDNIRQQLTAMHEDVQAGKMMSSEAITYKKKVFAFYGRAKVMCFKLGRDFDLTAHGIDDYEILSPFKNKAPMRDWFLIPDQSRWSELSEMALAQIKSILDD